MSWTTEKPTEPGWYWVRVKDHKERIVYICQNGSGIWLVCYSESDCFRLSMAGDDYEWQPVQPPTEGSE